MIKIVLCDDEVRFLEIEKKLIAEYFEDKGMTFSVESYSSGEELLKDEAMLKTADLIILDIFFLLIQAKPLHIYLNIIHKKNFLLNF